MRREKVLLRDRIVALNSNQSHTNYEEVSLSLMRCRGANDGAKCVVLERSAADEKSVDVFNTHDAMRLFFLKKI